MKLPPAWTGKGKTDLMNTLAWVRENFILGMAVEDLLKDTVWADLKSKHLLVLIERAAPLSLSLSEFSDKMNDEKVREKIFQAYHAAHKRAASRESFELIYTYCAETKQLPALQALPWYQFIRLIRNTASHGRGGFIKWPEELLKKGISKVNWRHVTFDASMDGNELPLGANETYQLMLDMIEFADKQLT